MALGGVGYFANNYFAENYWEENYFAEAVKSTANLVFARVRWDSPNRGIVKWDGPIRGRVRWDAPQRESQS